MMTKVMPTAMMALMEVCWAMFSRFETVRKCGVSAQKVTTRPTRPQSVPNCRP